MIISLDCVPVSSPALHHHTQGEARQGGFINSELMAIDPKIKKQWSII